MFREPEYDQEQYDMFAALKEYEAGLGHHGLPLEETMSIDADPANPNGKYMYVVTARRDWYDDAIEQAQKQWPEFSAARKFSAVRVER